MIIDYIIITYVKMYSLFREKVWAELQCEKEEGELSEYIYKSDIGTVIYRFFKREAGVVDGKTYYDIASYRGAEGPYIEEVLKGKERELLIGFRKEFEQFCEINNVIAEFAKLDPWDEYIEISKEVYKAEYYGNFYCNDLTRDFYSLDYNRRAKRAIKKACEMGVTVYVDYEGDTIADFVRLYHNTENKYDTNNYYMFSEEYIKKYFEALYGRCFLINAKVDNKIITSVLVAMGEDIMHYLYLGSDPNYLAYQGNSLLTYETSLIGKNKGMKIFDMGGGKPGGNVEGFKRSFISDDGVWEYFVIKKVWNEDIYQQLLKKKENIKNEKMFPKYRG